MRSETGLEAREIETSQHDSSDVHVNTMAAKMSVKASLPSLHKTQ